MDVMTTAACLGVRLHKGWAERKARADLHRQLLTEINTKPKKGLKHGTEEEDCEDERPTQEG